MAADSEEEHFPLPEKPTTPLEDRLADYRKAAHDWGYAQCENEFIGSKRITPERRRSTNELRYAVDRAQALLVGDLSGAKLGVIRREAHREGYDQALRDKGHDPATFTHGRA